MISFFQVPCKSVSLWFLHVYFCVTWISSTVSTTSGQQLHALPYLLFRSWSGLRPRSEKISPAGAGCSAAPSDKFSWQIPDIVHRQAASENKGKIFLQMRIGQISDLALRRAAHPLKNMIWAVGLPLIFSVSRTESATPSRCRSSTTSIVGCVCKIPCTPSRA